MVTAPSAELARASDSDRCMNFAAAFRETVRGRSAELARSVVEGWEDLGFEATAQPLGDQLCRALDNGVLDTTHAEERARILADRYGWAPAEGLRLWCFGPQECGVNAAVRPEGPEERAAGRFTAETEATGAEAEAAVAAAAQAGELDEARGAVVAACRWAAQEGPLCEETVRGVRFSLRGTLPLPPGALRRGTGAVVAAARRCLVAAQLGAQPGLQEPLLWVEIILASSTGSSAACARVAALTARGVLEDRGATILSEDTSQGVGRVRILAELTATQAMGLEDELAEDFGSNCKVQAGFARWVPLPGDPFAGGEGAEARHRTTVEALRRWRQLREDVPKPTSHADSFSASATARVLSGTLEEDFVLPRISLQEVLDDTLEDVVVRPRLNLQMPVVSAC